MNIEHNMGRTISGDLHEVIEERTKLNLKGVLQPSSILLIQKLRERAKVKFKDDEESIMLIENELDISERDILVLQYEMVQNKVRDDLTKVALVYGHRKQVEIQDPFEAMMGG